MPTDQPFLTVAWSYLDHFTLTWTHSGTDVFGFFMTVWKTGTSTYIVANQVNNPALREYAVPPPADPALEDSTSYSAQVTALSTSGHVVSRTATIVNGTRASYTFFDGPIYTWAGHDNPAPPGDYFGSSFDYSHLADYTLPTDFLPTDAIPLAVSGAIRYGTFQLEAGETWDHKRPPTIQLFGRPSGYTPAWTADYPITVSGLHASGEWLSATAAGDGYITDTQIDSEYTWQQADYPSVTDPHTAAPWTRANLMSYRWGWAWNAQNYQGLTSDLVPVEDVYTRLIISEGRITMFKVYVDYAFPPTYDDTPVVPPVVPPTVSPPAVAPSYHLDERIIRRLRRAPHVAQEHVRLFYRKIELDLERGVGLPSGQGSDPLVMLRLSRDGGHTWSEPLEMSAGKIGVYTQRVIARRLGAARDTVFEVTVSDPVAWSLVNAWLDLEAGTS